MCTTMSFYVLTKWLTSISLLAQFYMMAKIYAEGELLWGVHQLGGVINEFVMRCILPQNFINSKVFLFLYWWYILAILVSLYSAFQFSALLLVPRYQRYSIKALLPTPEFFGEQAGADQHNVLPGDSDPHEYFADYLGFVLFWYCLKLAIQKIFDY
uniref:Innexin n=3 Tax=Caenorhabditis japonica TaxID=281687 RepID=A0A8R1EGI4_CAEJA